MKKYIRIVSVLLGIMICALFAGGIANAANFDISREPTEGVTVNGNHFTRQQIRENAPAVYAYITDPLTTNFPELFFNANADTQNDILNAFNQAGTPPTHYTLEQVQIAFSKYFSGLTGYITYYNSIDNTTTDINVIKGTFIIGGIIGIVNDNGNYRLANGTRGNLATTPGVTRYLIFPPEGNNTWVYIKPPTPAAPTSASCTQSGSTWNIITNWTPVSGARNYKIRLGDLRDAITGSGVSSHTFTGITSSGTYSIALAVTQGNSYSDFSPAKTVTCVASANIAPEVTSFTASPASITSGQSSTLTWASTNADKCTLGGVDKATSGTMTVSPTSTTTYNIVCSKGNVNSTSKSATVTVNNIAAIPEVTSFTASPASITSGQSSTLTWASTNADKCTLGGVDKATSGTMTVSPTSTTTYNIVCSKGNVNSTSKSATVTVNNIAAIPEVTSFTASPASITSGQSSTLTWASTNADKCTLGGVDKATSGTMTVSPTSTTTYNIVCSKGNVNSTSKSATVTVGGVVVSTNPYARFLSAVTVTKLDTWIATKIVVRSNTLTATNYSKFIDGVITTLYKIKSETPTSNKNKRYMINYLIFSLQQIQDGIDDEDDFLNGLL